MQIKIDTKKLMPVFLLGAGILLVLGVGGLFVYFGIAIHQEHQQEKTYAQELVTARELLEKRKIGDKTTSLIRGKDSSSLVISLTNLAMKNNIHLTSLEPAHIVDEKDSFYKVASFDMEAGGLFKDFGVFLDEVRADPEMIIDVDSLMVMSDNADPRKVKAKISFFVIVGKEYGQK
jgi:hypothetical protein